MRRAAVLALALAACERASHDPPPPRDAASEPPAILVERTDVRVEGRVVRDAYGDLDQDRVKDALRPPSAAPVTLALADDALYQRLVWVVDIAKALGRDPWLVPPEGAAGPFAKVDPGDPAKAPIVVATADAVSLLVDGKWSAEVSVDSVLSSKDRDIPALRGALESISPRPVLVILQADKNTVGSVFNRILRSTTAADVPNFWMATKHAP